MPDFSKIILGTAQFGLAYGINNANGKIPMTVVILVIIIGCSLDFVPSAIAFLNSIPFLP